jgi:hypothetical protein
MTPENTSFCKDHSHVVELCGSIDGKMNLLLDGQKEFRKDIQELWKSFRESDKASSVDAAITKTKVAPLFWVLMIVGSIILSTIVTSVIHFVWPTAVIQQEQTQNKK